MFSRLKGARPSPALVISLIALFVSLGGVGYAAVTITGKNVKNSSLTGKDVKNSSLTGSDVKNSSLTGSDIKNDKLTGSDVLESSLGKVPSATGADSANTANSAGNANTVGGKSPAQLRPTSAFGQSGVAAIPVTTGTTVATTTINTASAGTLQATGSVEIQGTVTNPPSQCRIEIDASPASLLYENVGDAVATTSENTIAVNGSRSGVPAGTHTVSLLCTALSGTIVADDAAISAPDAAAGGLRAAPCRIRKPRCRAVRLRGDLLGRALGDDPAALLAALRGRGR